MMAGFKMAHRIPPQHRVFSGESEYQTDGQGNYRRIDRLFVAHKNDPKNRQLIRQRIVPVDAIPGE